MDTDNANPDPSPVLPKRRSLRKRIAIILTACVILYVVAAYVVFPALWKSYTRHHPWFDDNPRITQTHDGHPGDPLNVGLVGTESQVKGIMQLAKWYAADALSLKSDVKIAADTVLDRSYDQAPVSSLYLFGRKEDLAFEQPVGDNPRHRHHVRFWRTDKMAEDGRSVWIGSATYDKRVGLSHTTGQVTHHIDADIDAERDHVLASLEQTHELIESYKVRGFHKILQGRNGGGDLWRTDGDLAVGVIATN
jgi:LssY C-terminus